MSVPEEIEEEGKELLPGGASLRVTEENKAVYIGLLVEHYLVGFCRVELSVLAEGFYDVLPADVLRATADPRGDRRVEVHKGPDADARIGVKFDATHPVIAAIDPNGAAAEAGLEVDDIVLSINGRPVLDVVGVVRDVAELKKLIADLTGTIVFVVRKWQPPRITALDLELIIAGLPGIDVGDWREHTRFVADGALLNTLTGEYAELREMFFAVLGRMDVEERAKVLSFACGSGRLPAAGFKGLSPPFTVEVLKAQSTDHLPTAHTCFNCICIPVYESEEQLEAALHTAADAGSGFGFR